MNQSTTPPTEAIDLRAESYSPDGKTILVSLAIRDSTERRTYSLPVNSLYGFIADLQKLKSATSAQPVRPTTLGTAATPTVAAAPAQDPNRINITVPKKWMLRSGLPDHPCVIMVFDPQTATQAGYALSGASAREMAAGLTKYADALASHEASKPKPG